MSMGEQERPASEVPGEIAHWGQQTICFAMSLRAVDVRKPIDDSERVRAASVEASRISQELWEKARNAAAGKHKPVRFEHITMLFARGVFEWAADHLDDSAV